MTRTIRCGVAWAAVSILIGCLCGCGDQRLPLNAGQQQAVNVMPADALVVGIAAEQDVAGPFLVQADAAAVGGFAVVLPEGAGTTDLSGSFALPIDVAIAGDYNVWLHCRWQNSCGNSVALAGGGNQVLTCSDNVYGSWHWVRAGTMKLAVGKQAIHVREREDGIAIDQVLLTRRLDFRPAGAIRKSGAQTVEVRRFADAFNRSPGHGLGWQVLAGDWGIDFSYDPNRVPNQYSLAGQAGDNRRGVLVLDREPWHGVRFAFSVSFEDPAEFGVVVNHPGSLTVTCQKDKIRVAGRAAGCELPAGQWHRIEIEQWAWVVRCRVNGKPVLAATLKNVPAPGKPAFVVQAGKVHFDDVKLRSISWQADDSGRQRIRWPTAEQWYRRRRKDGALELCGRAGDLPLPAAPLPAAELFLEASGETVPRVVNATATGNTRNNGEVRQAWYACRGTPVLRAADRPVAIRRVAIRYARNPVDRYRIGPYHFTENKIDDLSDYLDFTDEEYKEMAADNPGKLRRRPKKIRLIGSEVSSPWNRRRGRWRIESGVLVGRGPEAELRHSQTIAGDYTMQCRVRFHGDNALAGFSNGLQRGDRQTLVLGPDRNEAEIMLPADDEWHRIALSKTARELVVRVDRKEVLRRDRETAVDDQLALQVFRGEVWFDDVSFLIPRQSRSSAYYAFDRRETDWLRTGDGQWLDHGGISCAIASSWISLIAPDAEGMLWYKQTAGPDVALAVNIEENTEWFGWDVKPDSHRHYPADNVRLCLGTSKDIRPGYRLELNAARRTATILYRNNKEVLRVAQNRDFPIRHVGGHSPYRPRKSRIILSKQDGLIRAVVNGKEVLRYQDKDPLPVSTVGFGGYRTRVNFSHIEVVKP